MGLNDQASLRDRVLEVVRVVPGLTDREITDRLLGRNSAQQRVNQVARALASSGQLLRRDRQDGKIGNYPSGAANVASSRTPGATAAPFAFLSEDDVKRWLQTWLEKSGWKVTVIWGRGQGIDLEATRNGARRVIEAKGQGSLDAMRVNYFLGVLGELLQRMHDPRARYSIALPDLPQFRRLWDRLPRLAKQRTEISALFVGGSGQIEEVRWSDGALQPRSGTRKP